MKKALNLLAVLLLAAFAYLVYRLPSILIEDRGTLIAKNLYTGGNDVLAMSVTADYVNIRDESGASTGENDLLAVDVTADFVNIRDESGASTGEYAKRGDVLSVYWRSDGWGVILLPDHWRNNLIWRGCTSDAGKFGCEAK